MATFYVYSGATGAADGSDWANAYTTITSVSATGSDLILVDYRHSESLPLDYTLTSSTISCEQDGALGFTPRRGDSVQFDSGADFNIDLLGGEFYGLFIITDNQLRVRSGVCESCTLQFARADGRNSMVLCDTVKRVDLLNCDIAYLNTGGNMQQDMISTQNRGDSIKIIGGTITAPNLTRNPTGYGIFNAQMPMEVYYVDVQAEYEFFVGTASTSVYAYGCKLRPSFLDYSANDFNEGDVVAMGCNRGSDIFESYFQTQLGTVTTDTAITLNHEFSYNFVTAPSKVDGAGGLYLSIYNAYIDMSSPKTFTVEFVTDGATTTYKDNEVYIVVSYLDSNGAPLRATSRPLSGGSTLVSSSASWLGISPTNSKQKVSVTTSEIGASDGYVEVRFYTNKAGSDIHVCPDIVVT